MVRVLEFPSSWRLFEESRGGVPLTLAHPATNSVLLNLFRRSYAYYKILNSTHTGRKCDSYIDRPKDTQIRTQSPTISLQNPFLDFPGTKTEHRFLAFFNHHTAPTISGCFDSDFWSELLPQVGQSEPSIQHAMIAIAAVHARLDTMDELLDGVDKREQSRQFELQQYNKAIHYLRLHISDHGITLEVTLMSCVLLICLEFLRGSIEQAILHLQGGMSILHASRTTDRSSLGVPSCEERITRKLNEIFFRLRGQGALCGRLTPSLDDIEFSLGSLVFDKPFSSLDEARSCLDHLLTSTFVFVHLSIKSHYTSSLAEIDCNIANFLSTTHSSLSTLLDKWSNNFESFIARSGSITDTKFFNGCTLLRLFYLIGSIWLSVGISTEETAFDGRIQEFSSLVVLASSLTSNSDLGTGLLETSRKSSIKGTCSFTFDMGAIAPLYLTAIACRDRKVRRQAMSLLASCTPRREGLWDADIMEYVARRVVEIEDIGLNDFVASSANAALAQATFMPSEQDRVVGKESPALTYFPSHVLRLLLRLSRLRNC